MAEREARLQGSVRATHDYIVRPLRGRDEIRDQLSSRLDYTAYAVGQLEPGLFERTEWYSAYGDTGTGLVLHSRGGLGDAMFVSGDAGAIAAISSLYPGPRTTYLTCQPQHLDALRRRYHLSNQQPMIRMVTSPETFKPVETVQTIPLSGVDIRRINGLYSSEGGPSFYVPEHVDAGIYFGVIKEGRLLAAAGTHVVAPHEGVAVVGNVFTHPRFRGRGFATAVTSAVTEILLRTCPHVVLTVDPNNAPAVRAYRRLGYIESCQLVEASAARRDVMNLGYAVRRLRASIRGRKYDGSFVKLHR